MKENKLVLEMLLKNKLVLEMLLKNKLITRQNIVERVAEAERSGNSILDLLLQDQIISQGELALILHNEWGFELYEPRKDQLDPRVLRFFSKDQARKHLVFPLNQEDRDQLTVLMADPADEETLRSVKRIADKRLKILVAERDCIQDLIGKYYHQKYTNTESSD